jgi:hypothetical protein
VEVPAGEAEFNAAFYQPIVRAAGNGSARISDLLNLPDITGRRDNPAELLGMLIGVGLAYPVLRPEAAAAPSAMLFNQVAARKLSRSESLNRVVGLASHRLGSGLQASLLDMLVLDWMRQGHSNIDGLLRLMSPAQADAAQVKEALDDSLHRRMPILRNAGVY